MRQVLFATLVLALASMASGCKLGHGKLGHALGWKHGCADGACGQAGCAPGGCPDGAYAGGLGSHTSPCEPFYQGHGPAQRGGLLDQIHANSMAGGPSVVDGGGMGFGPGGPGGQGGLQATPPASAGAVSYPYYTTRGPRDFLSPNPRGIGP
jgi:hypothetical protein